MWAYVSAVMATALDQQARCDQQQAAARQANMDIEFMVQQGRTALGRPVPQLTCPNCGAPKAEHICAYCKT